MIRSGKLDAQNRVALPVDMIEQYLNGEKQVIMTFNVKYKCLDVWTVAKFQEIYDKFENSKEIDAATKKAIRRSYFSRSETVKIDSANRIVIPQNLKELAGIDREVVFNEAGIYTKYFEIWDKRKHEPATAESDSLAVTKIDEVTEK